MTYRSYLGAGIRRTTIVPVQSQSESMDAIGLHQVSPRPMARSRAMSSTWATGTTAPGLCSTARRTPREPALCRSAYAMGICPNGADVVRLEQND
jgi:hypothetical protein